MADTSKIDINKYKSLLRDSKTAYTPNTAPTDKDLNYERQLVAAQNEYDYEQSEIMKNKWYGDTSEQTRDTGYWEKAFKVLGAPFYAQVGAVESVLGKGSKPGVLSNIKANIDEGGTYGDLLRSYGTNKWLAAPIGFALDVAMDPLAWATGGMGGLMPKAVKGAQFGMKTGKGAMEGMALGAKSGALTKAEGLGRIVPGLTKKTFETGADTVGTRAYKKVSEAASRASDDYWEFMGKDIRQVLEEEAAKVRPFEKLEDHLKKSDTGRSIIRTFGLDAKKKIREMKLEDIEKTLQGGAIDDLPELGDNASGAWKKLFAEDDGTYAKTAAKRDPDRVIENQLNEAVEIATSPSAAGTGIDKRYALFVEAKKTDMMREAIRSKTDDLLNNWNKADTGLKESTIRKLNNLGEDDLFEFGNAYQYYESGVKKYDEALASALASKTGRKILSNYARFTGAFKTAKIGGNLAVATTNAVVGNLSMTSMYGIDVLNDRFFSSMKKALSISRGKNEAAMNEFLSDPAMLEVMKKYPTVFQSVFGLDPMLAQGNQAYFRKVLDFVESSAGKSAVNADDARKIEEAFVDTFSKEGKNAIGKLQKAMKGVTKGVPTQKEMLKGSTGTLNAAMSGKPSAFITEEIMRGPYFSFVDKVKKMADDGSFMARGLHWYMTKPMEMYNTVDQTYRVGIMKHLWDNGITEKELLRVTKRIPLNPEDVVKNAGRNIYKIKPEKGMEIASEMYMNYMAMPSFVNIMRVLPIAGSPFFSFAYGMGGLAAKTAVHNPSFYNKVQFLLHEMSGDRGPIEKEALASPYYSYLDREGYVKIPFFEENPVYLNAANMLPHYTMNIFQPVERTYSERFGSQVAAIVDKMPFLKTPEGQVLFDYVIQPLILKEENPKGMFDQPLWPTDATGLEKFGYGVRQMAESISPPLAGVAGLVAPTDGTEAATEFIPSFRWRQIANATRGKTSVGVLGNEDPTRRTVRALGALAGFPTYAPDLTYAKKIKK